MKNQIFIVGIGPGNFQMMTNQAQEVLEKCDIIVGYKTYVDLIKNYFPKKEFISSSMHEEIKRCELCFNFALEGKTVALISSGDSGVYGMASPMFEMKQKNPLYQDVELVVIPGITAATSGSAILGAPLNNDFCTISLSDLMTSWQIIEKRLIAALQGDFVISIYNPSSHKRKDYLKRACEILLNNGAEKTRACAYVENIGRENTKVKVCTLNELKDCVTNMFTTVFIGNSQTEIFAEKNGEQKLITKRGYKI